MGQNGTGEIPGLQAALLDALRSYAPSDLGVCVLSPTLNVTLPIADWAVWGWIEVATVNLTAAQAGSITMFTMPQDERGWMEFITIARDSGDNTINSLNIVQPAGYGSGDRIVTLMSPSVASTTLFWPDLVSEQTLDATSKVDHSPLLLEPGGYVYFSASGAGASASVFRIRAFMRRTKVIRQRVASI